MSDGPVKGSVGRFRQALFTLLAVAVGAHIVWTLLAPIIPLLVSIVAVLVVLGVALFGPRSK